MLFSIKGGRHVAPLVSAAVIAASLAASAALAQTPPTVRYQPEAGARRLIFSNNPEQVFSPYTDTFSSPNATYYDLADANLGSQSLLQVTVEPGQYRNYFEHQNRFTQPIYYGVHVFNPGSSPVTVTLVGKGFTGNATAAVVNGNSASSGASAIADMMNQERNQTLNNTTLPRFTVNPGRGVWVLRSDIDFASSPNNVNAYAAGVVDFNVADGSVVVSNVAYRTLRNLGSWTYPGYNIRQYAALTPESRVYKGLFQYPNQAGPTGAGVIAELNFTINDGIPVGELPVTYNRYAKNTNGDFVETANPAPAIAPATVLTCWFTNDVPSRDKVGATQPKAYQVANDMFDINMPTAGGGSLLVRALRDGTWPNTAAVQPNLGNYGVMYHERITITNNSATGTARRVNMTLNNYSASSSYAYPDWSKNDGTWTWDVSRTVNTPGNATPNYQRTVTYASFEVPGDGLPHTFDAYFMLGAPAGGQLRHAVRVMNAVP